MYCGDWNIDCQLGLSRAYHNHVSFSLYTFFYSPLWGCMGDWVEMVVKVHCGSVLGDEFVAMLKMRLPKQSHNALWQPRPGLPGNFKMVNCYQPRFPRRMECRKPPSIAQDIEWTSQIDGKLQENLADLTKKIERLRFTFTANGERQI